MAKQVLSIGQCAPDNATLSRYLASHFGAEVVAACTQVEGLQKLESASFDLVLVNRKLDIDYSDGMEVLRAIKAVPSHATVPVMMITNYPEYQEAAVAAGAVLGFGKLEYDKPDTLEKLRRFLD